jgi:hypothetical protein
MAACLVPGRWRSSIAPLLPALTVSALALAIPAMIAPAAAQEQVLTAEAAIERARSAYGPPAPAPACPQRESIDGEILVCGQPQDDSRYRVQSTSQLDPRSAQALKDPVPRPPNVDGPGIFQGPATMGGGCFLNKCPLPPAYMVDFSRLPEVPTNEETATPPPG